MTSIANQPLRWAILSAALAAGCGVADEGSEETVEAASSALVMGPPVAWINTAGTAVTRINAAALRTDFADGGRVVAFNVLRTSDGGWALAKIGRSPTGACRTQTTRMVASVDGSLSLRDLNQTVSCLNQSCPIYPQGPEMPRRDDWLVLDEATLELGFCHPTNDMSGCYCANDGGACLSTLGAVSGSTFLR